MDRVKFTTMKDGNKADFDFLTEHEVAYTKGTADRLLEALVDLDKGLSGYQITRLGHSLQTATRAERDGADTDWIVAALLHDIGDIYAPYNHDEYAAAVLRPFVREQVAWVVEKHGDFQMIYYDEHVGADPEKRQAYAAHAYFDDCAMFLNAGTNRRLTQAMIPCRCPTSLTASAKFSHANPMTQTSLRLGQGNL